MITEERPTFKERLTKHLAEFLYLLFISVVILVLTLSSPTPVSATVIALDVSMFIMAVVFIWTTNLKHIVFHFISMFVNLVLLILMLMCFHSNQHPTVTYEKAGFIKIPNQAKVISGISQHLILKDVSSQVQVEYKDDKGKTKVKTFNITQDSAIQIANAQHEGKSTTVLSIAKYKKVYVVKLPWNTMKYKPSDYSILSHRYRPQTDKDADKVNDELYYIYLKNE